jgi:pre-mRNA 3'-end-processing factor FIP1
LKKKREQAASAEQKETPVNIKPGQQGKPTSTPAANATSNTNATGTKSTQGGINLEAVGEYNGEPITDVDLDNVEDKPWRKPGADITDYFNYGFNEVTWRSYCAKQKMLRENKKMMGDMDMGDFMSMGMMMPPNMMDGSMPMPMPGMPNPMMGLPMGMPPPPPQAGGNAAMRSNRGGGQFNARGTGRNTPMSRPKNPDGKERDGSNEM